MIEKNGVKLFGYLKPREESAKGRRVTTRINYPDEMIKGLKSVGDFLVFDHRKMENVVRKDAPASFYSKQALRIFKICG